MRNAKRRGNASGSRPEAAAGVEEALGPVDFAVGDAKSRAAARMLAEQFRHGVGQGAGRAESGSDLGDAWRDPNQAWALAVENVGPGRVHRTVYAPAWMGAEDVRRFLYGGE